MLAAGYVMTKLMLFVEVLSKSADSGFECVRSACFWFFDARIKQGQEAGRKTPFAGRKKPGAEKHNVQAKNHMEAEQNHMQAETNHMQA